MPPKGAVWRAAGLAVIVVAAACNSSTPTEPNSKVVPLSVVVSQAGPAGTLTVADSACTCFSEALTVSIDGTAAGTVACGTEQQFQVTARSYTVEVSARALAFRLTQTVQEAPPDAGVLLSIRCTDR